MIKRLGSPALFLVPTCLLVEQQARALHSWTGLDVAKLRGGVALPPSFDVLVATPEAFRIAQRDAASGAERDDSFRLLWGMFRVVVFDEVRGLLRVPYRAMMLLVNSSGLSRETLLRRKINTAARVGVPGGPMASRVSSSEVEVVGSILPRVSFLQMIDRPKARQRCKLEKFDANRRA